jgi:hypothetical protein
VWEGWQTRFNPVGVGVDIDRQLVIYHRWEQVPDGVENVVIVLNFSESPQLVDVPFPVRGRWTDRLAGFAGGQDWLVDVTDSTAPIMVESHFGRILHRLNLNP